MRGGVVVFSMFLRVAGFVSLIICFGEVFIIAIDDGTRCERGDEEGRMGEGGYLSRPAIL